MSATRELRAAGIRHVVRLVPVLLVLLGVAVAGHRLDTPTHRLVLGARDWNRGYDSAGQVWEVPGWRTLTPLSAPLEGVSGWVDPGSGLPVLLATSASFPSIDPWGYDPWKEGAADQFVRGFNARARVALTPERRSALAAKLAARTPTAARMRELAVSTAAAIGLYVDRIAFRDDPRLEVIRFREGDWALVQDQTVPFKGAWSIPKMCASRTTHVRVVAADADPTAELLVCYDPETDWALAFDVEHKALLIAMKGDEVIFPPAGQD